MDLKAVRVNCLTQVGEISQAKVEAVKSILGPTYDQVVRAPFGFILADTAHKTHCVLASTQVTYAAESEGRLAFDLSDAGRTLAAVFGALLLEKECDTVVNAVAHVVVPDRSASELLRNVVGIPAAGGIGEWGLKAYVQAEGAKGEMRVEPFIRDASTIYFEMDLRLPSRGPLDNALQAAPRLISAFEAWVDSIADAVTKRTAN